jgi:hypothetical protein
MKPLKRYLKLVLWLGLPKMGAHAYGESLAIIFLGG